MLVHEGAQMTNIRNKQLWCLVRDFPCTLVVLSSVIPLMGVVMTLVIGSCPEANYLLRNSAMDDSIGGS